ncbi:MAG TPA: POTRA domain-containing protein [Bacteroidota bacterium]
MRHFVALSVVLAFGLSSGTAQVQERTPAPNAPLGILDTVIIAGNAKTKAYVILNEMALHRGDTVTAEAIEYDRNRIYSLGLFTRVDIAYDSLESTRFLFVDVSERWYWIPLLNFGFRDGDPKRIFGGAGIQHENVGGRNQKFRASVIFGSDPSAGIAFADPLLFHEERIFFSTALSFSRVRNKSEVEIARTGSFDEFHYNASVTFGKRFSLTQVAGLTLGFEQVEVSTWWPGRTVSVAGKDRYLYATGSYVFDSRDLFEYPTRGAYTAFFVTRNGFGESAVDYTRYGADLRGYLPLPLGFTVATRLMGSAVAGGEVPTYGHQYFGYGERIRGWFSTVLEGEDLASGTIELRHFIIPPRIFRMTMLPLPEEFSIWRLGLAAALFANTGAIWNRGDRIGVGALYSGYGGGLDFLLPYSWVIRLEYGWNQYGKGQFILDLRGAI